MNSGVIRYCLFDQSPTYIRGHPRRGPRCGMSADFEFWSARFRGPRLRADPRPRSPLWYKPIWHVIPTRWYVLTTKELQYFQCDYRFFGKDQCTHFFCKFCYKTNEVLAMEYEDGWMEYEEQITALQKRINVTMVPLFFLQVENFDTIFRAKPKQF